MMPSWISSARMKGARRKPPAGAGMAAMGGVMGRTNPNALQQAMRAGQGGFQTTPMPAPVRTPEVRQTPTPAPSQSNPFAAPALPRTRRMLGGGYTGGMW